MSTVYNAQIDTALRLIRAKGQEVLLTHREDGEVDPATGRAVEVEKKAEAYAVFFPTGRMSQPGSAASGLIRGGRATIHIAAKNLPFTLREMDTVTVEGQIWTFEVVDPLAPNGEAILFTGTVKR